MERLAQIDPIIGPIEPNFSPNYNLFKKKKKKERYGKSCKIWEILQDMEKSYKI